MIVYALDVALRNCGVAVIQNHKNNWRLIHDQIIKTKKTPGLLVAEDEVCRMQHIMSELAKLYRRWVPTAFVAELPHGGARNAKAMRAMSLGKGGIIGAAATLGIPLIHVTPTEVKMAATGYKDAEKDEVIDEIVKLFPSLKSKYRSERAASGWTDEFEHVADAIGAFIAGKKRLPK